MNKVWIYYINYYTVDDEYGHHDLQHSESFVFSSKESAEKWKKDWEDEKNLIEMSGNGHLYNWYYGGSGSRFDSYIEEKEVLNY
jgi:hypothetical protein